MDADCPCCSPPWAIAPSIAPVWNLMKMTDNGEPVWIRDMGTGTTGVGSALAVDKDDAFLYFCAGSNLLRLNLDSSTDFSVLENAGSHFCNVSAGRGSSGKILTHTNSGTGPLSLRDASGSVVWTKPFGVDSHALDPSDNVYITESTAIGLFSYDSAGTFRWQFDFGNNAGSRAIGAIDASQLVTVGDRSAASGVGWIPPRRSVNVISTAGALLWTADTVSDTNAAAISANGNIIIGGDPAISTGGDGNTTRCFNSSGVQQWAVDHSGSASSQEVRAVATDSSDNVYAAGRSALATDSMSVRKYDSTGTFIWSADYSLGAPGAGVTVRSMYWAGGFLYIWGTRIVR